MTHAALIDFYRIANMKRCVAIEPRIFVCLLSKVLTQLAKKKEEKASCASNVLLT